MPWHCTNTLLARAIFVRRRSTFLTLRAQATRLNFLASRTKRVVPTTTIRRVNLRFAAAHYGNLSKCRPVPLT